MPTSPTTTLAFELLESKLRPPHARDGLVARQRLVGELERSDAPIVFISAGAGWGKTTLLAEWATQSERPFAWMSADQRDNDPIVLLTYLAVALDRVSPLDGELFDALASPGVSVEATVVPRLGAALATRSDDVVLAVDDVHFIQDQRCVDALAELARHVPEGSQLALAGRDAPLAVGALRARGLAREIGAEDLSMDATEARELLNGAGVDLPDEAIAELTEHTEGWSAGLYLAALSMKNTGKGRGPEETFTGRDRWVADYLGAELLANLPADDIRFLTRTSVLERLSGPLCDAVLEEHGSADRLEALARSNRFLVPLDGEREWYRYHHLFQELLRAELTRTEPELAPALLGRAIEWCIADGQLESAIAYAQQAGDADRVAQLVESSAFPTYLSGRSATTERWFSWLEDRGALEEHPGAAVLGAAVAALQGQPAEAERRTEAAMHGSQTGRLPDGTSSIDAWRATLGAIRCRNGVATMTDQAEQAVATLSPNAPFRVTATLLLGVAHVLSGRVDEADDRFGETVDLALSRESPEAAIVALGQRGALAIERGEWVAAEEFAEHGLRLAAHRRLEEYPTTGYACAVAARAALFRGDKDRAQDLLARAQRLRGRLTYAIPQLAVQARIELAHAYLALADAGGAETVLRETEPIFRRTPDLGTLGAKVEELRAQLKTLRADSPGASTLTTAELRVLPYLATHLSFREIGERLFVSRHTVKSQAMAIYRKLSVTSRNAAVERAREIGLL